MIHARNFSALRAIDHLLWSPDFFMNAKCRIYIVDHDSRMRQHLVRFLRAQGFDPTPFSSGSDFLEATEYLAAGIALVELSLPGNSGLAVQEELLSRRLDIPLIMMAASADISTAVHVIKKGAVDFLEKPFPDSQIIKMLDAAQPLLKARVEAGERKDRVLEQLHSLTSREKDIMWALDLRRSSQAAADDLALSIRTVEMYRARIMKKFGVPRFSDVTRLLLEAGLQDRNAL